MFIFEIVYVLLIWQLFFAENPDNAHLGMAQTEQTSSHPFANSQQHESPLQESPQLQQESPQQHHHSPIQQQLQQHPIQQQQQETSPIQHHQETVSTSNPDDWESQTSEEVENRFVDSNRIKVKY